MLARSLAKADAMVSATNISGIFVLAIMVSWTGSFSNTERIGYAFGMATTFGCSPALAKTKYTTNPVTKLYSTAGSA